MSRLRIRFVFEYHVRGWDMLQRADESVNTTCETWTAHERDATMLRIPRGAQRTTIQNSKRTRVDSDRNTHLDCEIASIPSHTSSSFVNNEHTSLVIPSTTIWIHSRHLSHHSNDIEMSYAILWSIYSSPKSRGGLLLAMDLKLTEIRALPYCYGGVKCRSSKEYTRHSNTK